MPHRLLASGHEEAPGVDMLHQWIPVRVATFLASGFGVGFIPVAPGTFGSLVGVGIVALLALSGISQAWYAALCVAVFLAGIPLSRRAADAVGVKDPGWVVIDEIAAILFIYITVPFNAVTALLGFAVFRVFDIAKPYPIRLLEKLPHGWGIMTDDVAAGFYTGLILAILRLVVPMSAAGY